MKREWVRYFVQQLKSLVEDDAVVIYEEDVCEKMQDIFDTIPVKYNMNIIAEEMFGGEAYYFKLVGNNNKEEFMELANNLEYLLRNNMVVVKSYTDFNNICNVIGRLGIKHKREVETNFAYERIWVIGIDREWK
ncbi:hypothetical protein CHOTACABRAS_227 [Bacillus phage Chotacabras]|nr:hypothetical protein CHOTACABRAS_227 [Bacillus phage Chotacabras]